MINLRMINLRSIYYEKFGKVPLFNADSGVSYDEEEMERLITKAIETNKPLTLSERSFVTNKRKGAVGV